MPKRRRGNIPTTRKVLEIASRESVLCTYLDCVPNAGGRTSAALRRAIADASGIVITTPEYNASVPGLLKNAIDWASRPYPDHVLRGKPIIVVGASISAYGATLAQAELRRVLKVIGAHVLEAELAVAQAHEAFAADGGLADTQLRSELANLVQALVATVTESSSDLATRRMG